MKGKNSTYRPQPGTSFLISAEHEDNDDGYVFHETKMLWYDAMFCVTQVDNCWPCVHKWDHIICKPNAGLEPARKEG